VYYEEGIARCSLEKAWLEGATAWRKPISCHLFPLRVSPDQPFRIRYEQIAECRAGRELGTKERVPLLVFLKEALTRKFDMDWYDKVYGAFAKALKAAPGAGRAQKLAG